MMRKDLSLQGHCGQEKESEKHSHFTEGRGKEGCCLVLEAHKELLQVLYSPEDTVSTSFLLVWRKSHK
jgi:hypothetical protein